VNSRNCHFLKVSGFLELGILSLNWTWIELMYYWEFSEMFTVAANAKAPVSRTKIWTRDLRIRSRNTTFSITCMRSRVNMMGSVGIKDSAECNCFCTWVLD
jgi:hypothetical protein